jgi:hypothetical protein
VVAQYCEATMHSTAPTFDLDDEPLSDEEIAQGFYTTREMIALGFVKDRQDQKRKQDKYGFPKPTKTGDRQAPTSRARVHRLGSLARGSVQQAAAKIGPAPGARRRPET